MIEQHYYTRDRKGVFSSTPGYDTVAKSKNLDNDFIMNYLNDLCFYEPPLALAGEEDVSKYPKAIFCVNTEDDKMIIGQSSFAGKDYTGSRNRYFTHNYIISTEDRETYIKNPNKIIYLTGFVNSYNIDNGNVIPEVLKTKQEEEKEGNLSISYMFNYVGLNLERFKQLIIACFHAAKFGKKVYIVLKCDESEIVNKSKKILEYLYKAIPFEIRRKIGFITYMKEPKNKKSINLIFLTKGSIKRLTTEIKAGYVFDFSGDNFYLDDLENENHSFIEFIIENINNKFDLNKFFIELDKFKLNDTLDISEYDRIIDFMNSNGINFYDECIEEKYKDFYKIKNNNINLETKENELVEKQYVKERGIKGFLNKIKYKFF